MVKKLNRGKKYISFICVFTIVMTFFAGMQISPAQAAADTNLEGEIISVAQSVYAAESSYESITVTQAVYAIDTNLTWPEPYPEGWSKGADGIVGSGGIVSYGADEEGEDFSYEADITLNGTGTSASQGGLVFRSTGTSYYNSYIAMLHKTSSIQRVELQKVTGSAAATILGIANKTIDWDTVYHMKVVTSGSSIKVYFNGETTPCIDVDDIAYGSGGYALFRAGTKVTFNNINASPASFDTNLTWPTYPAGWSLSKSGLLGSGDILSYAAHEQGEDFSYEADITLNGTGTESSQAGLVFRSIGESYSNSYIAVLNKTSGIQRVELQKIDGAGGATVIAAVDKTIAWDTIYHLKAVAEGSNIKVYFNGETDPCINEDDSAYAIGKYGLYRKGTDVTFNNVQAQAIGEVLPLPDHKWCFENDYNHTGERTTKYNGTGAGEPAFVSKEVREGTYALDLDGNDDEINMGNVPVSGSFTLAFWVKPRDIHRDWAPMLSKFGTQNSFWVGQHSYDGKLRFGIYLDGSTESYIDTAPGAVVNGRWTHVVCSYDGHHQKIYIDGNLVEQGIDLNTALPGYSNDFEIAYKALSRYAGLIDDVQVYNSALTSNQVGLLFSGYGRAVQDVSLLIDQLGYRPNETKMAIFRSAEQTPDWNPADATFKVIKKADSTAVKTGKVEYWGSKWDSYWWKADFSSLDTQGEYYLEVTGSSLPTMKSSDFSIGEKLILQEGIIDAQLTNLDSRIVDVSQLPQSSARIPETGTIYRRAENVINPNCYALSEDIHIYRDCGGSNMCELQSATITTNALVDILEYQNDAITSEQRASIKDKIKLGANYLVDCQEISDDPNTNGRMHHMGMGWSEQEIRTYAWRDMPKAIIALVRAYRVFKDEDPTLAKEWLDSARLAYECMTYRPYYLLSELSGPVGDFAAPSWNYPALMADLRKFYNKDDDWNMPRNSDKTDLRTRDIFPAIWACTQLYSVDPQEKYLDKAEELGDIVSDRQFMDYNNPIEDTYGNFYEFDNDTDAFTTEMHQWSKWNMGNYDPLRLKGIIELLKYRPNDTKAAKWYNMLKTYGESYLLKHTDLSPFGIIPLTMNEEYGISFYRVLNHGANSIYGLAAVNMLEMGNFLNNNDYQDIAARNVSYITGMNPGFPNRRNDPTDWGAFSWAYGMGEHSYGGNAHIPPVGSISNGFTANSQFSLENMGDYPDSPNGIYANDSNLYFHEDGVMHSLSFLNGVVRIESDCMLDIKTTSNSIPVEAGVQIVLDQTYNYSTGADGILTIDTIPVGKAGTVSVTYNGSTISRDLATLSSGKQTWNVDFKNYVDVSITVPGILMKDKEGICTISVTNRGNTDTTADVSLSAAGAVLGSSTLSIPVNAGESANQSFTITGGSKTMPYLVYAHVTSGNNVKIATSSGKITSDEISPVTINVEKTNVSTSGGDDGNITITAQGGSGSYEYSIDNGKHWQSLNTFSGLIAGNYQVKARDRHDIGNECEAITVTITEPHSPSEPSKGKKPKSTSTIKLEKNEDGSVKVTGLQFEVDKKTAKVKAKIDADDLKSAFELAKPDEKGKYKLEIELPRPKGAEGYELELQKQELKSNDKREIEIKADIGTVTLPCNMLDNAGLKESGSISLSFEGVKKEALKNELKSEIGDRPVIKISFIENKKLKPWENKSVSVRISLQYTPKHGEDEEHVVVLGIDEEGKVIKVPNGKYNRDTGMVEFGVGSFGTYAIGYVEKTFNDLHKHSWAKRQIEVLASKGIIKGTGNNNYSPENNMIRADFITLLVRTLELKAEFKDNFDDVKEPDYYYEPVGIAKRLGIVEEGLENNKLNPESDITREEMMVMMDKALRVKGLITGKSDRLVLERFKDKAQISVDVIDSVAALVGKGLIKGANDKINLKDTATRAEVATVIYRMYNME